jgi:hypothetical protein
MDRTELLTYLASVRKEESERLTRQGLTSWALLGAMVALLLLVIPEFSKISSTSSSYLSICLAFTYFHVTLVFGSMYFGGSTVQPARPADYRFPTAMGATDIKAQFLSILAYLVFPAATSFCAEHVENLSPFASLILTTDCWTLGILGILVVGSMTWAFVAQYRGEPTIMFLSRHLRGMRYWVPRLILGILFSGLFVSNATLFANGLLTHQWQPPAEATIAIATSLLLFVSVLVLSVTARSRYQVLLGRLERDLVLFGISPEEVRARLEQEYLGSQLNDWVLTRLDKLRTLAADISTFANKTDELIALYKEQSGQTTDEIGERVRHHFLEFQKCVDAYATNAERLVDWLKNASPHADEYIGQVIAKTIFDIREVQRRVRSDMKTATEKTKQLRGQNC